MSKRPADQLQEQPATKHIHIEGENEEEHKDMNTIINSLVQSLSGTLLPPDQVLALVLIEIMEFGPSDACMKPALTISQSRDLIKRNPDLERALRNAVAQQRYEEVISLPILRNEVYDHEGSVDIRQDNKATFNAFKIPYVAGFPGALLRTVDTYFTSEAYNNSISIIQSSGTGKSRGVAEAAQLRFSFLINLRGNVKYYTYPPPDVSVRNYLFETTTHEKIRKRYSAFLCSLFTCALKLLSGVDRQGVPLAQWWYQHLNAQATESKTDPNRSEFYKAVVKEAKILYASKDQDLSGTLQSSCANFVAFLQNEHKRDNPSETPPRVVCILVFDEAQELMVFPQDEERSDFHHLGSVLKEIVEHRVFSVFLSTNSNIRSLPSPVPLHPSSRQAPNRWFYPPITELPFDVFAKNLYNELHNDGRSTLSVTCSLDIMVRFGRAMWHSLHTNGYRSIVRLAMAKLNPTQDFFSDTRAQLACLALRIGLDFDTSHEVGRIREIESVESYMRVVFTVPRHLGYIRTGTPSEPILAEAATRLLNEDDRMLLGDAAPRVLSDAFQQGFLARGERGEVVARLLWTLAHDRAVRDNKSNDGEMMAKFHKPIRVVDFLRALFHDEDWKRICEARPMGDDDGLPLHKAFKDAYISFSHFMDGMDHDIDLQQVYRLLLRGAALNCQRNQRSIDFLAPILFGHPDSTTISRSNTSVMQAQVKNRNKDESIYVDPTLVKGNHPVLSLVHHLGSTKALVECTPTFQSGKKLHGRHYQIVCYGCTSKTYAVVPNSVDHVYPMLLGSNSLMEDFSRHDLDECKTLFRQLDPCSELQLAKQGKSGQQGKVGGIWSWFGDDVE